MEECEAKIVNFLDPSITAEAPLANFIFLTHELQWRNVEPKMCIFYPCITADDCIGPKHYGGGVYSQYVNFLDPCITVEEGVAKNMNFWTNALQQRNV